MAKRSISQRHGIRPSSNRAPLAIFLVLSCVSVLAFLLVSGKVGPKDPIGPLTPAEREELTLDAAEELHLRRVKTDGRRAAEADYAVEADVARARAEVQVLERLRERSRALAGPGERDLYARAIRRILERAGGDLAATHQHAGAGQIRDAYLDRMLSEEVAYLRGN